MRIGEVEITGFKGIPYLTLHPKKINILVGKNNSGKTSILEAINSAIELGIAKLQKKYDSHLSNVININKEESKILVKLENETRYVFLRKPNLNEIVPEFKKQLISSMKENLWNKSNNKNEWETAEEILDKILSDENFLLEIQRESIMVESGNKSAYLFSYTPLIFKRLELFVDYLDKKVFRIGIHMFPLLLRRRRFPDLDTSGNEQDVVFIKDLLTKATLTKSKINEIETYLKDRKIFENLERFDPDILLFKNNGKEYEIPVSFMGDGFKSLIGLIAQTSKETKIVLLEEPENHMHPAYIKEIIRQIIDFSIEKDVQFFITTHNFDILEMVSIDKMLPPKHQDYLSKELNIIRLDCLQGDITPQELTRADASNELEELKLDLRGN